MTQIRALEEAGPNCFEVFTDDVDLAQQRPDDAGNPEDYDGYLGDVELESDGTWAADISCGNAAPKRGFATRDEAVAYVVDPR